MISHISPFSLISAFRYHYSRHTAYFRKLTPLSCLWRRRSCASPATCTGNAKAVGRNGHAYMIEELAMMIEMTYSVISLRYRGNQEAGLAAIYGNRSIFMRRAFRQEAPPFSSCALTTPNFAIFIYFRAAYAISATAGLQALRCITPRYFSAAANNSFAYSARHISSRRQI